MLLVNKDLYNGLDDEIRGYIDQVATETGAKQRQLWADSEIKSVELLEKEGMKFNDVNKDKFQQRVTPVYEKYYAKYGDRFKKICQQIKDTK